ncbi:MAG: hypothetical protein M0042_01785 [Nitrospiraceae bacterium]|nr:hypothetical protein [Nitrospiraceae bacterium]
MKINIRLLCVLVFLLIPTFSFPDTPPSPATDDRKPVEDIIPLTAGNLRGHKMLYDEGWYIVTSSRRAFQQAKKLSLVSSRQALQKAVATSSSRGPEYTADVQQDVKDASRTTKGVVGGGTELTGDILKVTHEAGKAEYAYAGEAFQKAADAFVRGNLTIAKRTEEDRKELVSLPGGYFRNVKSDFSNLWDLRREAHEKFSGRIDAGWDRAFQRAGEAFRKEYDRSGEQPNTLMALGPILSGYLKSLYHGVVAPTSKSVVKTTSAVGTAAVFLPIAGTAIVAGRTVQSAGLTVYYTAKTGIKLVSPTIESGLLSGMAILSLGAVPVTYVTGASVGAVNQVAFTTAGTAIGALEGTAMTAGDTAKYVGLVAYDGVKGVTTVVINQAGAGLVLGYNALTAIPSHTLLAAGDAVVFLAWDGPRLAIAAARGKIKTQGDAAGAGADISELAVGTVVDLKDLKKTEGVDVQVLSEDSAVIRDVLQKIPCDLREGTNVCE